MKSDLKDPMRSSTERGIAMITAMLVLMLMSALLVGFTTVVMSDQRYRFIDRDRGQSFYAASGGIEKLTADLGNVFFANVAPSGAQVTALTSTASKPAIAGVTFTAVNTPDPLPASSLSTYTCVAPNTITTVGANGYTIKYCANPAGNPTHTSGASPIRTGPFEGLIALQTPYQLDVTARSSTGGEVHLVRTIESVAIPVFQFGMFSDVDLSFFAGPNFGFGGRVHTNGNLFLSQGNGATLTLSDKVTAAKEIVRQQMQNGVPITTAPAHTGTVRMAASSTTFRDLAAAEGSVVDGPTSAFNEPPWQTVSLSYYNSWLRNNRTGARALSLPLISVGGSNRDLVRRAVANEHTTNSILYGERLYSRASLRILLSDNAADITSLPNVQGTPVRLDGNWNTVAGLPAGYGPITLAAAAPRPPVALSPGMIFATAGNPASGGAGVINVTAATAAAFKPTFWLAGRPANEVITCTGKETAPTPRLTGCKANGLALPVTAPGTILTAISTSGGAFGASAQVLTVSILNERIEFATVAEVNRFNPMPFWDGASGQLVTCTGFTTTTYTGCSSNPVNNAVLMSAAMSNAGTGLLGGFIKIDRQNADGTWNDVTTEILNYGIGAPNLAPADAICPDPTPGAIIRLQRLRDNGDNAAAGVVGGGCNYNTDVLGGKDPANWWPNVLFDPREGLMRDTNPGNLNVPLGGVMHYVAMDVANVSRWFAGTAPYAAGTGNLSKIDNTGFTVYFSDRRNNRTAANLETGEYGFEDFVNPIAANGSPNGVLDTGEDVNASTTLDNYGATPSYNGTSGQVPPGAVAPLDAAATPTTTVNRAQARTNRAIFFRRALELINGSNIAGLGVNGLTVVAENPVYVKGDWNVVGGDFDRAHAATSVIADAVTLLSNQWIDTISFTQPYAVGNRNRGTQTYYRMGIIAGKGIAFPQPAGTATDFGTDGGAHNFLRYLENGNQAVNFRGSIATFFHNRQGVGTYKCCNTVYGAPLRNYVFDLEFLDPARLPPNTPVFRDMNAVGFSQELRPGK